MNTSVYLEFYPHCICLECDYWYSNNYLKQFDHGTFLFLYLDFSSLAFILDLIIDFHP